MQELIVNIAPNLASKLPDFYKALGDTMLMVLWSGLISFVFGLLLGVVLTVTKPNGILENKVVYQILDKLVSLFRSIPFIILLTWVMPITRALVGTVLYVRGAIVPLVFGSVPFFTRQVESALAELDGGLIEAALSMGSSPLEIIFRVYLKESIAAIARGTTITLHVSEAESEFLEVWRVREVLDRYCSFMSVPIYLDEIKEEEAKVTGEGEDAEEKPETEKEAPKPINDTQPLYARAPQDCTDEDYKQFYRKVFHEYEDPLFWIHLNVDYPFKLKGILYFPKIKEQFGGIEGQIKLYSGQVFVADNIKEVIPEFLMLLKGVIDCADFPLNVSRSFLQNDGYVRRISNHITKKVAARLTGMFKTERETYEGFWPDIHPFIKYGVMRDEKFAERMKDCLLFKTTDGKFLTLAEYKERNGEKLPDKMVYTSDPARQDAAIRLFTERGIDVTVLDQPIDVNFVSYMEYSADPESKFRYCRVDAELDSLTSTEDAPTLDSEKLTELMREASGNKDLTVEVKPLVNDSVPVMLVEDEQTRRFNDMGRIYGHSEFTMPAKYSVVLNSRSRTIEKLAAREKDERSVLLARQLYDLAELSRQPLEAEQMTEFIRRSMEIVDIAALREISMDRSTVGKRIRRKILPELERVANM